MGSVQSIDRYDLDFSPVEKQKAQKFITKHSTCHAKAYDKGNLKAKWSFNVKLRGTGIGTWVGIKCKCCGKEEDITDYDSW